MKYVIVHDENEPFFSRLKYGLIMRLQELKEWVIENKKAIIILAPICVKGATTVIRVIVQRRTANKKESLKKEYCYDRSLGHYWKLNRELTNKEWLEIDRRKRKGEKLADILSELNVLK